VLGNRIFITVTNHVITSCWLYVSLIIIIAEFDIINYCCVVGCSKWRSWTSA